MFCRLFGSSWFSHLASWKSAAAARRRRAASRGHRFTQLRLGRLEARLVPAVHVWQGAVSPNWSDAGNWISGGSPVGDHSATVVFPATNVARLTSIYDLADGDTAISNIEFDGQG